VIRGKAEQLCCQFNDANRTFLFPCICPFLPAVSHTNYKHTDCSILGLFNDVIHISGLNASSGRMSTNDGKDAEEVFAYIKCNWSNSRC